MMVEYVLLLTIVSSLMVSMFTASKGAFHQTFNNSAPRLGARVEGLIRTGEGFNTGGNTSWTVKK
jgi:Flp pilus assembly pilin Flp